MFEVWMLEFNWSISLLLHDARFNVHHLAKTICLSKKKEQSDKETNTDLKLQLNKEEGGEFRGRFKENTYTC